MSSVPVLEAAICMGKINVNYNISIEHLKIQKM